MNIDRENIRILLMQGLCKGVYVSPWSTQVLEYDIVSQGDTPGDALENLDFAIKAEQEVLKELPYLSTPKPAPQWFHDQYAKAEQYGDDPNVRFMELDNKMLQEMIYGA